VTPTAWAALALQPTARKAINAESITTSTTPLTPAFWSVPTAPTPMQSSNTARAAVSNVPYATGQWRLSARSAKA